MRRTMVSLVVLASVLAGCAGTPDGDDAGQTPPQTGVPAGLILHRAGELRGELDPADLDAFLANLTAPVGALGHTGFDNGEPTLGVTSDGALFMSATHSTSPTTHVSVIRSQDHGATWDGITPMLGPVSTPPTTFDPYVHVDQDTDRIFNLDMEGLNCNYIQWSDDGGDSFTGHALGCGQPPVLDHPTLFTGAPRLLPTVGYDNIVYLCVNRVADASCATSLDGGLTFDAFKPVFTAAGSEGAQACGGLAGHGTTDPEGRAYWGKVHCGIPTVAVSDDDGLTWDVVAVSTAYPSTRHDVEVASDAAGNIYALWSDDAFDLRMSVSTDHGASWSEAVLVSAPDVNSAVFPAITAGDEGKVAIVYYGSETSITTDALDEAVWTAYIATVPDALALRPIVISTPLTTPQDPIARGPCDDDNRCDGVGDFIDIVIDAEGRPWAALFDSGTPDDGDGMYGGAIGTLLEGIPLRGEADALPVLDVVLE